MGEPGLLLRSLIAVAFASLLTAHGLKKRSLSRSGAAAAWFVGFLTMGSSVRMGLTMITFYHSSSTLTKYKSDVKSRLEDDFKEGGQRSASQVLACSLLATLIAVYHAWRYPADVSVNFKADLLRSGLLCAFVGHYACCNGDTWASELGVLSPESPRLITSLLRREVPKGTNGGISIVGTLASVAGGATIGAVFTLLGWALGAEATSGGRLPWWLYMTALGAVCGFVGSMVDSLLGAVLQATWYCPERKHIVKTPAPSELQNGAVQLVCGRDILTNEQVNVLSVLITTMLAPWIGSLLW